MIGLSGAQKKLAEHLSGELEPPKTVAQIKEMVGAESSTFRQQYSSAQYRSWLSEQLKSLSEAGEIGRFKEGRTVLYAESPELAVRHWARLNERFPQNLSVGDSAEIKEDTGMPGSVISNAIREISND
jgi:DNA-binding transcriptional regulator GbsR (MarR family)